MTDKEHVLKHHSEAVVLTREREDKIQYRISPRPVKCDSDIPRRGFLSNWCTTEQRAWRAAVCRMWHRTYSHDEGW